MNLAELHGERPVIVERAMRLARAALMLWGAVSLGAAAGTGAYYFAASGGGEPLLVGETTGSITPVEDIDPEIAPELAQVPPHLDEFVTADSEEATPPEPDPIIEARLPRPRPDEPFFTGSLERPRHARYADPCEALNALGAQFAFRIRCRREARTYEPPPPRVYYPRPYQPPHVVR